MSDPQKVAYGLLGAQARWAGHVKTDKYANQVRYRKRHPDRVRERARRYKEAHPEELRAKRREHYLKHREEVLAQNRQYREAHVEDRRRWAQEWRQRVGDRNVMLAGHRFAISTLPPEAQPLAYSIKEARKAIKEHKAHDAHTPGATGNPLGPDRQDCI